MGALANATKLRTDETFKAWVTAAVAYQARLVILNDSTAPSADQPVRLTLAREAAMTPDSAAQFFITAVACDPAVAGTYSDTTNSALEQIVIDKVAAAWTVIAHLLHPNG